MPPRSHCPTRSDSKTACSRSCARRSSTRRSSASSAGRSPPPHGCARPSASSYRPGAGTTRARTSIRQNQWGVLAAEIEIRSAPDLTELLAHEFEHLIEQLDGADLKALAKEGMAHRLADGAFETARAVAAGQQVAGEVTNNAPDRVRGAGKSVWRALRRAVGRYGGSRRRQRIRHEGAEATETHEGDAASGWRAGRRPARGNGRGRHPSTAEFRAA